MKSAFVKKCLWLGMLIFSVLMSGCSGANQISPTLIISPIAMPSATLTMPTLIPSPMVSIPESTPTSTIPAMQTNLISVKDNASFVSENYPDNSVLKPGEKFVKTFEIKNVGAITWTTSYTLTLDTTSQNETLDGPARISLSQETPPGNTISLSLPLTAPTVPGTYTVYWSLRDERGEIIPIDGSNTIWVKILVCDPSQPCNPPTAGGGAVASGVSATLTNFTPGAQSTVVSFCMTLPSIYYSLGNPPPSLIVDQKTVHISGGTSLPPPGSGCYEFEFPVSATDLSQAKQIALSIDNVRIEPARYPDEDCQSARLNLMAKYPGLDFQCHFTMAGYYTNLQLPAGMAREQAQQIIVDAIESAIRGPWVLTVR